MKIQYKQLEPSELVKNILQPLDFTIKVGVDYIDIDESVNVLTPQQKEAILTAIKTIKPTAVEV